MPTNTEAERQIAQLPHVLSATAPFLSDRMSVVVDFPATDGASLVAFGESATKIAGDAGYPCIEVTFSPRS